MNTVLTVMIIYMLIMLAVGFKFSKKANSVEGYFLSDRNLPTPVLIFTFAATWIGASATLGKSGLAYSTGISAIYPTLGSFIAFFVFSAFAGRIRTLGEKHNVSSIPNLFYRRFGKLTGALAAAVIAWTLIGTTGTQLIAFSKILVYIFQPYGISYEQALIGGMVIVVAYTVLSGMYAVAYTDVVQGLILLIVIGCILPFGSLAKAGGAAALSLQVPKEFFQLHPDLSLVGYTVTSFLYFVAGPPYWQRAFAAKSNKSAGRGALGGNIIIIFYSLSVVLIGICASAIYPNIASSDTEMVLLIVAEQFFHPIIYAITVSAIVAVIMSTTDSYLILSSQTITMDLIGQLTNMKDEAKLLRISRLSVSIVGILSLVFALHMQNIFQAMMLSMTQFAAGIAVPALAALFSKKVTKPAMSASIISGLTVSLLWTNVLNKPWGLSESIAGSVVSLVVIVVVSMTTQKSRGTVLE